MRGFLEVFRLEIAAAVRSKTLAMLTVASLAWMFVAPFFLQSDGTADGARELYVHYAPGGVFALLVVSLLASATGVVASERAAKRLQLSMVRPVRYFTIALAKISALVACGAAVLALSFAVLAMKSDLSRKCCHVVKPMMPSPAEEAEAMYKSFMADPSTPAQVKSARKSVVIRLLANRAIDNYQTIATNDSAVWKFAAGGEGEAVRIRFSSQFDMRRDVRGVFRAPGLEGVVSNITQAIVTIPLRRTSPAAGEGAARSPGEPVELSFENRGTHALMLRPRRDIDLLVPADSFLGNLARSYLQLVAILALLVSFGVFLSAALGRPVALFTAVVALVVSEMSPSVVAQYPDELEKNAVDRIGLALTRFAAEVTRPVSSLSPLESLATDACVEPRETARVAVLDLLTVPLLLSLLAAVVMPRKEEDS